MGKIAVQKHWRPCWYLHCLETNPVFHEVFLEPDSFMIHGLQLPEFLQPAWRSPRILKWPKLRNAGFNKSLFWKKIICRPKRCRLGRRRGSFLYALPKRKLQIWTPICDWNKSGWGASEASAGTEFTFRWEGLEIHLIIFRKHSVAGAGGKSSSSPQFLGQGWDFSPTWEGICFEQWSQPQNDSNYDAILKFGGAFRKAATGKGSCGIKRRTPQPIIMAHCKFIYSACPGGIPWGKPWEGLPQTKGHTHIYTLQERRRKWCGHTYA